MVERTRDEIDLMCELHSEAVALSMKYDLSLKRKIQAYLAAINEILDLGLQEIEPDIIVSKIRRGVK